MQEGKIRTIPTIIKELAEVEKELEQKLEMKPMPADTRSLLDKRSVLLDELATIRLREIGFCEFVRKCIE